jgi:hypothetical protein
MARSIVQDREQQTPPEPTRPGPARLGAARPPGEALGRRSLSVTAERVGLGILTTLVSINLWTGGPVLALWVGSRIQAAVGELSMAAVGATIGVLIVETYVLYKALAILNTRYNEILGRVVPRQQAAWLKPMSGERRSSEVKRPLTAVERIVVVTVVFAVLVFEVWFFFFAHYTFAS